MSATPSVRRSACGSVVAARTGYETKLVHNITDINDKIYDAAPGESAELAADATAWYLEDTATSGSACRTTAEGDRARCPQIVRMIEELVARGHAYAVGGDVYFRVATLPRVRPPLGSAPRPGRGAGAELAQGGPRDFALWKANKPETEDTWWDSPWGRGRPGWHIECSVMAEEIYGPAFEIHGGGLDLVFPHHENEVAQSRSLGHPFAQIWAHNGMLRFTGEKMSKSVGERRDDPRDDRRMGARGGARLLPHRVTGASRSTSPTRRWRRPPPAATRCGTRSRCPAAEHDEAAWAASPRRSRTTSTRPRRSQSCTSGPRRDSSSCCAAGSRSSGSSRSPSATRRRRRSSSSPSAGAAARGRARLRGVRPAPRRARRARMGDARRAGRLSTLVRAA